MRTASFLLVALYCAVSEAFVVGATAGRLTVAPCRPRSAHPFTMKSDEDKEFEEWVRQKKLASGVDPDEDFAGNRQVANAITAVGGIVTVVVPVILGLWAYNAGYLTPQ